MFGGKREKALEEQLAAVRQENEAKSKILSEILEQKDVMSEQFAGMTASRAQIEKEIVRMREEMQSVHEWSINGENTAGDIYSTILAAKNGVSTFHANHSVFVNQMRKQGESIVEIVENNKHFTTPMKHITEAQAFYREEHQQLLARAARMMELSKNMSVLALNAAIEAGRLGEAGNSFVVAAEEVRTYAEGYEREARELEEQLMSAREREKELEEQVHYLNELLKENNISMGKLYKDSVQNMATYEGGQTDIRDLIPQEIIGRTDALRQSQQESAKTHENLLGRMDGILEELKDSKRRVDEQEALWEHLYQSAQKGSTDC